TLAVHAARLQRTVFSGLGRLPAATQLSRCRAEPLHRAAGTFQNALLLAPHTGFRIESLDTANRAAVCARAWRGGRVPIGLIAGSAATTAQQQLQLLNAEDAEARGTRRVSEQFPVPLTSSQKNKCLLEVPLGALLS